MRMHSADCPVVRCLWQYSDAPLPTGASNAGGYEKSHDLSTNISLCLENGHIYYGTPIGTRMQFVEWCDFQ